MEEKMILMIGKELKNQLKKEAKEKGLSLSAYVRLILVERNK